MTEQKWEFCELRLRSIKTEEIKKGSMKGQSQSYYDCNILYYSPSGEVISEYLPKLLAQNELQPLQFNPFSKAMGLLGAAGWELVSVQYGIVNPGTSAYGGSEGGYIRWDNRFAYFKRSIVAGRAINEPKLNI